MYEKNLSEFLKFRLSSKDMEFLRDLSSKRSVSISACIRDIIAEYRRSFYSLNSIDKEVCISDGDGKTYINNKLQY